MSLLVSTPSTLRRFSKVGRPCQYPYRRGLPDADKSWFPRLDTEEDIEMKESL